MCVCNMSSRAEINVQWIEKEILSQLDAAIEQFTLLESGEEKTLKYCKVVVNSVISKLVVEDALDMYYHLFGDIGETASDASVDRIQSVMDHFCGWIELELSKRYA